ncbi:WxcM-like domain-containing protein [Niabella sp. CC-SYL272]|uniref:WxcM-like domain-containing protein n=1 Tax=Niabella agricola TaxID=2891571 RepID=UPI001F222F49|nr:WxcM-like domain-containing protein [Niabella agricola]MCF3109946.1 WxcM-like domain-containing protein [Niabella agricola]
MNVQLLQGGQHTDQRGSLLFNNGFDASPVKRIYTIEHNNTSLIRGWMGHEIENRWFTVVSGGFQVKVKPVSDWLQPELDEKDTAVFTLKAGALDVLHIPPGHIFSLQALEPSSKILVMADHPVGTTNDEHRYPV